MMKKRELPASIYSISLREGDATGNSFIVVYGLEPDRLDYKKILTERGLDSALFVQLAEARADHLVFTMRVLEKDGSESSFCGNGSRFLARFFHDKFGDSYSFALLVKGEEILLSKGAHGYSFTCAMPKAASLKPLHSDGHDFYQIKVLGEPHLVTFDALTEAELTAVAEKINKSGQFPEGTNVNSVKIQDEGHLTNTTYERGVNAITKACGSGSLGVFAISRALSFVKDEVQIKTKGGLLHIQKSNDHVTSTGAATIAF